MRRFIVTLVAAAAFALASASAWAWTPRDDYYPRGYAPNYGYQANNYYGGWAPRPYSPGFESFPEAAARIRAAHSRYRYFTHPRSLYNAPPAQADYYGWGWAK
jgi:hypothetical protein